MGVTPCLCRKQESGGKGVSKASAPVQAEVCSAVYFAFIHVALNDLDRAFESFHKAYEERSSYLIFLNVQPSFEKLRSDPRYEALSSRMNLNYDGRS